jgi:NitT/TauT family transport system substrate-binding protein
MAAAMSANGIDAMNTWEPHVANAKKALGARATELDTKGIYAETFNVVTSQDFLAAKQDVVVRFVRAMVEAHTWMKANAERQLPTSRRRSGCPARILLRSGRTTRTTWPLTPEQQTSSRRMPDGG